MAGVRTGVALALALPLAGCGNTSTPPTEQALGTLDTFLALCAEKHPLRTLPTLLTPAQSIVLRARDPAEGCGRVLGLPGATGLRADDFRDVRVRLRGFDGAASTFAVAVAGTSRRVRVTYGEGGWRLEGPGG